jgi:hypothetical protein
MDYYKKNYPSVYDFEFLQPVSFSKEYKNMLAHAKELMEYKNGQVAIHPRFNKLISAPRTAVENGEGMLEKHATSYNDIVCKGLLAL